MVVFGGPVAADGFDWYLVVLTGREAGADQLGWVATPPEGDAWLVPSEIECPSSAPDVLAIAMERAMPAYCYHGRELTLEGWGANGGVGGCDVMGTFEPTWLAHPCADTAAILSTTAPRIDPPTLLYYPVPGVTSPMLTFDDEQLVRIVGHYDDPAASGCVIEPADPPGAGDLVFEASDPAADAAVCRMRFVVTEVTPLQ